MIAVMLKPNTMQAIACIPHPLNKPYMDVDSVIRKILPRIRKYNTGNMLAVLCATIKFTKQ